MSTHYQSSQSVARLLSRLGGVYRDPSRISRDSTDLLSASIGQHLRPSVSQLVENDGRSSSVLMFSGTISMLYRGNTYNIPIDIYLPSAYPISPPTAFVRPIATMMIKERHKHVASSGMVYMPYFNSWNQYSHNLIDTCHNMSRIFGKDPPVFARPPGAAAPTSNPSPPSYNDIQASATLSASTTPTTASRYNTNSSSSSGLTSEERRRLAELEREAAEANAAVEAARRADQKEEEDRREIYRLKDSIVESTRETLQAHLDVSKVQIQEYLTDQMILEKCEKYITGDAHSGLASGQMIYLKKQKDEIQKVLKDVNKSIDQMEKFIHKAEKSKEDQENKTTIDELALPEDIHSAQMICLSAENAAITDALYFLDKGLAEQRIDLETHLRAVRKLAKRQFLIRAHLLKVGQVKISETFRKLNDS